MNDPQGTDTPRPTALVSAAVDALASQFFEPLAVSDLLRDAWEGATVALARAGRLYAPPPPEFPRDPVAAYALHDQTFPKLERLADGKVSRDDLATAAIEELLARRHDVHTVLCPRGRFWAVEPDSTSPAGWASRTFGMVLTDTPPLSVSDVLPNGPAQRAGVRRGQAVLAINGQPTAHLRGLQAIARLDWQAGATNLLTARSPCGVSIGLELHSDLLPMPFTKVLPGPIGYLRMDRLIVGDPLCVLARGISDALSDRVALPLFDRLISHFGEGFGGTVLYTQLFEQGACIG